MCTHTNITTATFCCDAQFLPDTDICAHCRDHSVLVTYCYNCGEEVMTPSSPYRHPNPQYVYADTRPFALGTDSEGDWHVVVTDQYVKRLNPAFYNAN